MDNTPKTGPLDRAARGVFFSRAMARLRLGLVANMGGKKNIWRGEVITFGLARV